MPRTLPNKKHKCFFIGYMTAKELEKTDPESTLSNIILNGIMKSPNCDSKLSVNLQTFFTDKCIFFFSFFLTFNRF